MNVLGGTAAIAVWGSLEMTGMAAEGWNSQSHLNVSKLISRRSCLTPWWGVMGESTECHRKHIQGGVLPAASDSQTAYTYRRTSRWEAHDTGVYVSRAQGRLGVSYCPCRVMA